jgi:hypothetical protein
MSAMDRFRLDGRLALVTSASRANLLASRMIDSSEFGCGTK